MAALTSDHSHVPEAQLTLALAGCLLQEREQMQRYNQRMMEQLKVRQQQEKARLPKIQRSEGKTRMAMYKKSLHINGAGSAAEQREKIKQVGVWGYWTADGSSLMGPESSMVGGTEI